MTRKCWGTCPDFTQHPPGSIVLLELSSRAESNATPEVFWPLGLVRSRQAVDVGATGRENGRGGTFRRTEPGLDDPFVDENRTRRLGPEYRNRAGCLCT